MLLNGAHYRSCSSRAYFAAYALLTALFRGQVTFAHGDNNPSHDQLYALVSNNLPRDKMSVIERRELKRQLRVLLRNRLVADYEPGSTVDRSVAMLSVRSASRVAQILEMAS